MKIYSSVQFIVLMEILLIKENFRINKKFVDPFFFLYYNMDKKFGGEKNKLWKQVHSRK